MDFFWESRSAEKYITRRAEKTHGLWRAGTPHPCCSHLLWCSSSIWKGDKSHTMGWWEGRTEGCALSWVEGSSPEVRLSFPCYSYFAMTRKSSSSSWSGPVVIKDTWCGITAFFKEIQKSILKETLQRSLQRLCSVYILALTARCVQLPYTHRCRLYISSWC